MTRCAVDKRLLIRDAILTQPRQGIELAKHTNDGSRAFGVTGDEGSGYLRDTFLNFKASAFEDTDEQLG